MIKEKQMNDQSKWNRAYHRGGNICFYPHEEIIRFINKYVRKRDGINEFHNVMDLSEEEWDCFRSLDLGCGIGRHVKFLDEFGLNPFGVDLSDAAVSMGKNWFQELGREELADKIIVGNVTELPYDDEFFWICVSCGTLDSMSREIAKKGMEEALRVLKKGGLMYLDLIMNTEKGNKDEIVDFGYEKDTVQSYFTVEGMKDFLGEGVEIMEFNIVTLCDETGKEKNKRAHLVIRKNE